MKIAFAGKGGAGKTTIAALFAKALANKGEKVLAVDCDPAPSLARALGIEGQIKPIVELKDLINERMEISKDKTFYKLNPKVDDIPEKFARQKEVGQAKSRGNIKLIVMGTVKSGGAGCICPESAFLKALLSKILFGENESVVMDMEAGVEHLGRATAGFVDHLAVVVEPSANSVNVAKNISSLAKDIGIKDIVAIANKIKNEGDSKFVRDNIGQIRLAGEVPFSAAALESDTGNAIDLEKDKIFSAVNSFMEKLK